MSNKQQQTQSPCIRQCTLNQEDICLGCFRYINEIINWTTLSEQQKQQVLSKCQKRMLLTSLNSG